MIVFSAFHWPKSDRFKYRKYFYLSTYQKLIVWRKFSMHFSGQWAIDWSIFLIVFIDQLRIDWRMISIHLIDPKRSNESRFLFIHQSKSYWLQKEFYSFYWSKNDQLKINFCSSAIKERSIEKWFQSTSSWKNDRLKNGYYFFHRSLNDFPLFIHRSKNNRLKNDFYPFPRPKIDRLKNDF